MSPCGPQVRAGNCMGCAIAQLQIAWIWAWPALKKKASLQLTVVWSSWTSIASGRGTPQNLAVILKPVLTISQWSLANNTLSTSVGNQCYIQTDLTPPPSVDLTPNGLYGCKDWIVPTLGCWRWSWSHFPSKNLLEELRSLLGAHCRPGVRSVWPEKKWEENSTWLSSDKTTNEHLPSFSSSLKKNETNQPSHTLYPQ